MTHPVKRYRVVKLFIGGILKGLTYEELCPVEMARFWTIGKECKRPIGGTSPYRIVENEFFG